MKFRSSLQIFSFERNRRRLKMERICVPFTSARASSYDHFILQWSSRRKKEFLLHLSTDSDINHNMRPIFRTFFIFVADVKLVGHMSDKQNRLWWQYIRHTLPLVFSTKRFHIQLNQFFDYYMLRTWFKNSMHQCHQDILQMISLSKYISERLRAQSLCGWNGLCALFCQENRQKSMSKNLTG